MSSFEANRYLKMAINPIRISKSKGESHLNRIAQRDYTIPVRLNQLPPSQAIMRHHLSSVSGQSFSNKRKQEYRLHTFEMKRKMKLKVKTTATTITCEANLQVNHPSSISNKKAKYQKGFMSSSSSSSSSYGNLMVNAIIIATLTIISTTICHCDTPPSRPVANKSNNFQYNGPTSFAATAPKQHSTSSHKNRLKDNMNAAAHKEHLLSYLSENIERQHFKGLKPVRALVQQRPSKFDSGDDLTDESSEISSNFVHHRQQNATAIKAIEKVDEGLKHIMRMHEHAHLQSMHNKPISVETTSGSSSSDSSVGFASKLKELSRKPARVASTLINPNKMVSQVLSYLSPLVSSKLTGHQLFDPKIGLLNTSSSLLGLNPFVGRSNNQISLAKNIFSNIEERKKNHLILQPSSSSPSNSNNKPFVTALPQTSFLTKPDLYENFATNQNSATVTQPTISLDRFGGSILKSALIKPNISPKDLMVDSSSNLANVISNPQRVKQESSLSSKSSTIESSYDENQLAKGEKPIVSSWLKDSANKLAQSYLQDSFRGLITLSQLPILQPSTVSTAPSVLEKGGSKLKDKTSNSQYQSQRNRAIDELFRYAYILGTSVGRKKDPLKALGSTISSSSNHKGMFSQRSRNQPTTQTRNQNHLLNYARGLKSILSASAAKPRGVMWDMATDPSLAVTVFHLLERASVALPLGFLLMPFVKMIHNPLSGVNLGGILPSRASHRSVDYEELAKRLDVVDKMLSRALRPTHRESFMG